MTFQAKIRFEKDSLWTFQWTNKNSIWETFTLNFPMDRQKFLLRKIRLNFPIDKQTKKSFWKTLCWDISMKNKKSFLEKVPLRHFHQKQKTFWKNFLWKILLKNFRWKTIPSLGKVLGWKEMKNQTLPGQNPRVKRNEKPYPPRVKITGVDKILPSLDGILGWKENTK